MDQPNLVASEHCLALSGLGRVNRISRCAKIIWSEIFPLAQACSNRRAAPLRVLDLACGGGDIVADLAARARKHGTPVHFVGADVSEVALGYANEQAARRRFANVEFVRLDVVRDPIPRDFDVIMNSLFLHHLDEQDAIHVLSAMAQATRKSVLVSDLRRTRLGYALAVAGTRFLSRSHIVHIDGPLSVLGAWTSWEALQLATRAGLQKASLTHHWPQRFLLRWMRT